MWFGARTARRAALGMTTTTGLIVFLVVYALLGAVLGFNFWSVSDQLAEHWRRKRWFARQIGRDNPMARRAGGLMMLVFGSTVIAWIMVSNLWQPPTITVEAALTVLGTVAITCVVVLLVRRTGVKASRSDK